MDKYGVSLKTTCVTLSANETEIPAWIDIFNKRYFDHLQRIDGILVQRKLEDDSNKQCYSIFDSKFKLKKKATLIITIYPKGTIMAQGASFLKWKNFEIPNIFDILEGKVEPEEKVSEFVKLLRDESDTEITTKSNDQIPTPETDSELNKENAKKLPDENNLSFVMSKLLEIENAQENFQKTIESLTYNIAEKEYEIKLLKNENKSQQEKILALESKINENEQNLIKNKQDLSKQFETLESKMTNLQSNQENQVLKYNNFVSEYNDAIKCEKTGERLSQSQMSSVQLDVLLVQDDIKDLTEKFKSLSNKVHDKINHFGQTMKKTKTTQSVPIESKATVTSKSDQLDESENSATSSNNLTEEAIMAATRSKANVPPAESTPTAFRSNKEILVVGDSILKGIKPHLFDKSGKAFIKTLNGRRIKDVAHFIDGIKENNLKSILCHVGTNDLSDKLSSTILRDFKDLIHIIKFKFPNVRILISSIVSRESKQGNKAHTAKIQEVNSGLSSLANELCFEIIDNSNLYDPNYRYDGLHLNNKGTAKMVKNFKEKIWPSRERNSTEENRRHAETTYVNTDATAPRVKQEQESGPIYNGYSHQNPSSQSSVAHNWFPSFQAQHFMQSQPPPTGQFMVQNNGQYLMPYNQRNPFQQAQFIAHTQPYVMPMQRNYGQMM